MKKSIDLPISEITLRRYEKPGELDRRELVRKICLSLGLLHPGDSRDIIVDIFQAILDSKKPLRTKQIMEKAEKQRKNLKLPIIGLTYPNVCRQLRKLKQLMLIETKADKYRLNEQMSLKEIFNEKLMKYYIGSIRDRINDYLDRL
jgi:hypothetical protein